MKAYYAFVADDPDAGGDIVFANTAKEAKKEAWGLDFTAFMESYIYLRVNRWKTFDDKENLSEREMALLKWHNGWWWDSDEPMFTDGEETTDQDFLDWWDGKHVKCDDNGGQALGAGHECICLKRKGHYGKHGCSCGGIW